MKNLKTVLFILFFYASHLFADKPAWTGIWSIWDSNIISNRTKPWYKGTLGAITWSNIEPVQGQFDFTRMNNIITDAVNSGLYIGYKVYVGNTSPSWIYKAGVPVVMVNLDTFPDYLNPNYKQYFRKMIGAFAKNIASYPQNVKDKIVFVQCPAGTSGDPQPWNGTPTNPAYNIDVNSLEWENYNKEMFTAYVDSFKVYGLKMPLVMKPSETVLDYLYNTADNVYCKTYQVAQGYQTNDDMDNDWLRIVANKFTANGRAIRVRGEMTHIDLNPRWYLEAPIWNMYTQCLWALTYGMDVLNIRNTHFTGAEATANKVAYEFFSNYAGYKSAEDSHGAWCALRDGLDYDDKVRFTESAYGTIGNGQNISRWNNIANAFVTRGAKMGETTMCWAGAVQWTRNATAMNDVARNPWKDNYGMFMTQYNPNATSVGYWRVGSISEPYGRFARGFENATGKNAMYFNIDDAFFTNKALNGQYSVKVKVVYFDQGTGSWELKYDAQSNAQKSALKITKTNTGTWKTATVTLTDAYFFNRCPNGTDLMLVNSDSEDDIFHLVEVTRTTGDRKGYWGYKPVDPNTLSANYIENNEIVVRSSGLNNLTIKFPVLVQDNFNVKIFTTNGRQIYDQDIKTDGSSDEVKVQDVKIIKSDIYIVNITGSNFRKNIKFKY
jgi:hypothetical protein